jgi:hypothetical protein
MMITTTNLPIDFTPCNKVKLCSNTILGGSQLFLLGNTVPLLVGEGRQSPRIWLQAISDPATREFLTVVEDSRSMHPAVNVSVNGSSISILVNRHIVLKAKSFGNSDVVINEIDLRPLGLNVHGDQSGLSLGGMQLSNNTMSGVGVAFALG